MESRASEIKRKVMLAMCNNDKIVSLIDNANVEYADDLIDTNIFPYLKIDYTVQDAGAYIGVAVDFPTINKNEIYKNMKLTILIVVSNGKMRVDGGGYSGMCRTDLIAEELMNTLDWNTFLGFKLRLYADKEDIFNESFYCRKLVFTSVSDNGIQNGVKVN